MRDLDTCFKHDRIEQTNCALDVYFAEFLHVLWLFKFVLWNYNNVVFLKSLKSDRNLRGIDERDWNFQHLRFQYINFTLDVMSFEISSTASAHEGKEITHVLKGAVYFYVHLCRNRRSTVNQVSVGGTRRAERHEENNSWRNISVEAPCEERSQKQKRGSQQIFERDNEWTATEWSQQHQWKQWIIDQE